MACYLCLLYSRCKTQTQGLVFHLCFRGCILTALTENATLSVAGPLKPEGYDDASTSVASNALRLLCRLHGPSHRPGTRAG